MHVRAPLQITGTQILWMGAGVLCLLCTGLYHTWLSHQIMAKRYSLQALYQQKVELERMIQQLEAEYASLTALTRVAPIARKSLGLQLPDTRQIFTPRHRPSATTSTVRGAP